MNNDCNHNKCQCGSCKCGISLKSIPAVLGDDTGEFKPENGTYFNTFVKYEANGAQYFYSKDGIFSKVAEIPEYVSQQSDWDEADENSPAFIKNKPEIGDVSHLVEMIEAEATTRAEQDEFLHNENIALGNELNAETNARTQKDTQLENAINNKADQSALDEEISNRTSEDATLSARIDALSGLEYEVVQQLPATGRKGVIYLVPQDRQAPDVYDEYLWVNTAFERIGSTAVDLIDYVKNTDIATGSKPGIVMTNATSYGLQTASSGNLQTVTKTYEQYTTASNALFVGKGTLENVLNGRKYLMPEYTLELPTTGEDNKLYLTPATEQPDVEATASGKDIELADASEGDLIDWTIRGDTEQDGEPTPVTPQEVKTVTGRNTVSIVGKNLIDNSKLVGGYINNTGNIVNPTGDDRTTDFIEVEPNTAYTSSSPAFWLKVAQFDKDKNVIKFDSRGNNITSLTVTTLQETRFIRASFGGSNISTNFQLEKGSSATQYQPYSGQEVEVNLGNIELCKLGDYQDRIFKDGDTWKIEKNTSKISSYNGESITTSYISTTGSLTNGATVYYALIAPVVTEITYRPLIDQLNELETLTTVKGYNHITTDTPSVQPFLEFGYFRPDPTVTKDEWLWIENHYEQLGGERRYTHNMSVNHNTAQGHWDYAFTIVGKEASHYTQLAQVAYYLFREHAGLTIPVSGTYTEGSNVYLLTKITASSLSQVTIEMIKLSDGSVRSISTGAVAVSDIIS